MRHITATVEHAENWVEKYLISIHIQKLRAFLRQLPIRASDFINFDYDDF